MTFHKQKMLAAAAAIVVCVLSAVSLRPAECAEKDRPYICVKGILYDSDVPLALINQEILGVGDTFANAAIVEITSSSVVFEYGGEKFTQQVGACEKTTLPGLEATARERVVAAMESGAFKKALEGKGRVDVRIPTMRLDKKSQEFIGRVIAGISGVMLIVCFLLYAFSALCFQKIAQKTATEHGWMAWVPVLNVFLMLSIAGKPLWWFLLLFIPLVNIIVTVIIFMKIAEACNKPSWLGILFLLPLVNLIVLGYFAFSKEVQKTEAKKAGEQSAPAEPPQPPKAPYRG